MPADLLTPLDYQTYKTRFEPRPHDFCLCGSGLAFRICCYAKYQPVGGIAINTELKAGNATAALEKCRRFLTWYRLSHLAHTAPFVHLGSPQILKLLEIDIKALEEISELLLDCVVAAGVPEVSEPLFASIETAVDAPRWRDAVFALRVQFAWRHISEAAAWKIISTSPQFAITTRIEVFMAWLSTHPENTPMSQRLAVVVRIRKCSARPDVHMLCALVEGGLRAADPADTAAIGILRLGIDTFRKVPREKRTAFGVLKYSQALNVLGLLTGDDALLEETITETQRYLQMSGGTPDEFSATVLCECGEACLGLGQPTRAIPFLESALSEDPSAPLPMIYLAKAHVRLQSIPDARRWLSRAHSLLQSEANKLDYGYVAAQLALLTKLPADITEARDRLAECHSGIGVFEKRRVAYLNALADIPSIPPIEESKSFLTTLFTRYVMLEPNLAGIGLRLNAMIDDGVTAHRNAQKKPRP